MTVHVTYKMVFKDTNHPTIEEFITSLDRSIIADFPEFQSQDSLLDIYNTSLHINVLGKVPQSGLVSTQTTDAPSGLSQTIEEIWESIDDYINFSNAYETLHGPVVQTYPSDFPSETRTSVARYINHLYGNEYGKLLEANVVSS